MRFMLYRADTDKSVPYILLHILAVFEIRQILCYRRIVSTDAKTVQL